MIPHEHQNFISNATKFFEADQRFLGLLGAGSLITGTMDQYSDVDLVAVYKDAEKQSVTADRLNILSSIGPLISAFTGEHVGEPRVYICLYKNPLLHVDVKFISISELADRVEDPVILFEKESVISTVYQKSSPHHPMPDLQWIEDRFWTWIHYAALRLGRGEYFEVLDMLSFLRGTVFGPLALVQNGKLPRGVRRIETYAKNYAEAMEKTVAQYNRTSCVQALIASINLYRSLRDASAVSIQRKAEAEKMSVEYFEAVAGMKDK